MTDLEKKLWKKVNRYIPILRFVPFLRMVAVCNNLAFGKTDEKSDIDLFIVAKDGRLFIVRFLVTISLHLLGVRRYGKKVAGRFCLSFFIDDSGLNLSDIAIKQDIYLKMWVRTMKPVLNDGVYGDFISANVWANPVVIQVEKVSLGTSFLLNGRFGDFIERLLKNWQLKRAKIKKTSLRNSDGIIVNEHILKFHNIDRRKLYRKKWFAKYGKSSPLTLAKFRAIDL